MKNSFIKNVVWVAGGTSAAQAITILSTPVITRLYSPADMGVLTVYVAILGIIGQLSTLRYSVTIPLADTDRQAEDIIKLCFVITLTLSIVTELVLLIVGDRLKLLIANTQALQYSWFIPISIIGIGIYETLSSWAIRNKKFKIIAGTRVYQGGCSSALKIVLGLVGIKPLGLLVGYLGSQVAGSGSLLIQLGKESPRFFKTFSMRRVRCVAKRYIRFPIFQSNSRLLLSLSVHLPAIFMAGLYGPEAVGLFGLAHSMVNLPMDLLGSSVSKVYYAEIARYGKGNPEKILVLTVDIIKKMFFLGTIPMVVILILGPWMFGLVFGDEWQQAGSYARLLAIYILTRFISSPLANVFDLYEMHYRRILLAGNRVVFIVGIFYMARILDWTPSEAILCFSAFLSLHYFLLCVIVYSTIQRLKKKKAGEQRGVS